MMMSEGEVAWDRRCSTTANPMPRLAPDTKKTQSSQRIDKETVEAEMKGGSLKYEVGAIVRVKRWSVGLIAWFDVEEEYAC